MQDLAQFQIVRAPRRPDLMQDQKLALTGALIDQLVAFFDKGDTLDTQEVQNALALFHETHTNPLDYIVLVQPDTPEQAIAILMGKLEQWLADNKDRVAGQNLFNELQELQQAYSTEEPHGEAWADILKVFASDLADWLAYWAAKGMPHPIATATRFALVTALASLDADTVNGLAPSDTWDFLNRRVVVFPHALSACFPKARVPLVRQATVADLHVVRGEWRGYVPGEIAMIRNVMAGETFEQINKQTNETETTRTFDALKMTQTQTDVQQTDESDLSRQVNTQLQVSVQGYLNTDYQQSAPGYSLSVSAGVSGGEQIGRSESLATKISRRAVSRAIATVQTQTREVRSQRTLIRTEESIDHKFGSMDSNRRGVYRWVDRIDRFQVFTYPNRLQLEFELPEPGEYFRWRTATLQQAASVDAPPPWDKSIVDSIKPDDPGLALNAAVKYRAANLPLLPDKQVSIVTSVTVKPDDLPQDLGAQQWHAPTVVKDLELVIPDGYTATKVEYSGYATPLLGKWVREYTAHRGVETLDTFHSIIASIMVGTKTGTYTQFGWGGNNTIQGWASRNEPIQFGDAVRSIPNPNDPNPIPPVVLDPPATGKLTIGVRAVGAGTMTVTFTVTCQRSTQTEDAWKSAVYDALFASWSDWNKAWQSAYQNRALTGALPIGESSPARNEQVVRDELKRQVIEWLLNESPFQGRKGLLPPGGPPPDPSKHPWRDIDLAAALESAPVIQFLEQAFEWANLTYVFYPYYWADRASWDALNSVIATDPAFESFLKTGSARVIVPARPGMEAAVHHWLLYQEPFLGRPMPIPGDPMYVSIATEIRDLMVPPEDGIPGESWEAEIGTTFLWLDDSGAPLPTNPLGRLGAPPNEPKNPLYPPPG